MTSTSRSEATFSSSSKLDSQGRSSVPHFSSKNLLLTQTAASAALYASRDTPSSKSGSHPLLDDDGKLSSAGARSNVVIAPPLATHTDTILQELQRPSSTPEHKICHLTLPPVSSSRQPAQPPVLPTATRSRSSIGSQAQYPQLTKPPI